MKIYILLLGFSVYNFVIAADDKFGLNSQIDLMHDMSTTCIDNLHTNIYLTFGMGVSDSVVIIVSDNNLYPNCAMTFYTTGSSNSVFMIVVIEFPDHTEGPKNACQDLNSNIYIKEPQIPQEINVCDEVNKKSFGYFATPVFSGITGSTNVTVRIVTRSLFETVKITATSARKLNQYEQCDSVKEILCLIANSSVCISKELLCDENINCGTATYNDEDIRICDEGRYKRLWLVVLCGTAMIIIIIFFLIHLLKTCLPSVPDSFFIFNEDEDNKLILSSQFVAPQELMKKYMPEQKLTEQKLPEQTSSFRLKSVPVTASQTSKKSGILKTSSTQVQKPSENERRMTIQSNLTEQFEIELESHDYKNYPDTAASSSLLEGKKTYETPNKEEENKKKQVAPKKPRFQKDIINIPEEPSFSDLQYKRRVSEQKDTKSKSHKESSQQKKQPPESGEKKEEQKHKKSSLS